MSENLSEVEKLKKQVIDLHYMVIGACSQVSALTEFVRELELDRGDLTEKEFKREMAKIGRESRKWYFKWLKRSDPEWYKTLVAPRQRDKIKVKPSKKIVVPK